MHIQSTGGGVGRNDRLDCGRKVADAVVQAALAGFVLLRPADVGQTASGQQSAGKSSQPFETMMGVGSR